MPGSARSTSAWTPTGPGVDLDGRALRFFDRWLRDEDGGYSEEGAHRPLRDGRERMAQGTGVAARARPFHPALPAQRGVARRPSRETACWDTSGPGAEPPDHFLFDPRDPVPTHGGALCCHGAQVPLRSLRPARGRAPQRRAGVHERRARRTRGGHRPGHSDPLRRLVRPGHRLHRQAGRRRPLRAGDQPVRRHRPRPLPQLDLPRRADLAGAACTSTASISGPPATGSCPGHRIRVEISSSNFPRFDRNPNTGTPARRRGGSAPGDADHPARRAPPPRT